MKNWYDENAKSILTILILYAILSCFFPPKNTVQPSTGTSNEEIVMHCPQCNAEIIIE